VQNIATLNENLDIEISNRENADADIQSQIGAGIFSPSFTITQGFQQSGVLLQNMSDEISQWQDRFRQFQDIFRIGLSEGVTVPAGGSTSDMLMFGSPFDSEAEVAVFPVCVGSGMTLTDLSCKVTRANYQGFSFDVYNGTQADVTIKVGYLAVKVG
jgi:hypothetical protein